MIDGVPVTGHQGPGTLTDELIHTVLQLQGTMHPHQVISLEDLPGDNQLRPAPTTTTTSTSATTRSAGRFDQQFNALLKPDQWQRLTNRLGEIDNPRGADRALAVLAARQAGQAAHGHRATLGRPSRLTRSAESGF